jgi:adenosyl cobinamide kinase/adenosyl cobinamide phosphate guanylyltransferase
VSLVLLLGGARSGKSRHAVRLAGETGLTVVFVATAEARDGEMAERIARHRRERPEAWTTIEEPLELADAVAQAPETSTLVIDCLSLWVANRLEQGSGEEELVAEAAAIGGLAAARTAPTIAVSNEVGLGIVPATELGRRYRDVLGRVNAAWAEAAEEAFLLVAGRLLPLERAGV